MNLTEYLRILVRRGWIILLLALLAGGSAYLISRGQTPVYRATQIVLIQPSRSDLGLTEASRGLLNSQVVFLNSREIAAEIIEELRLDMTPAQLLGDVTIAPDNLRLVVQIDVNSTNPDVARDVARAWGQRLVDYRDAENQLAQRQDRVDALLPDQPTVGQIAPRPRINAAAGAVLGLLIGAVVVFVLEYLESIVVRRRDDLERTLDMNVLASIPGYES